MIWAFLSATQAGWLAALPNVVLCSELFLCCSCCWELQAIAPGAIPYKPLCSKWKFRWSRSYMKELDHHWLETTHLCMCLCVQACTDTCSLDQLWRAIQSETTPTWCRTLLVTGLSSDRSFYTAQTQNWDITYMHGFDFCWLRCMHLCF